MAIYTSAAASNQNLKTHEYTFRVLHARLGAFWDHQGPFMPYKALEALALYHNAATYWGWYCNAFVFSLFFSILFFAALLNVRISRCNVIAHLLDPSIGLKFRPIHIWGECGQVWCILIHLFLWDATASCQLNDAAADLCYARGVTFYRRNMLAHENSVAVSDIDKQDMIRIMCLYVIDPEGHCPTYLKHVKVGSNKHFKLLTQACIHVCMLTLYECLHACTTCAFANVLIYLVCAELGLFIHTKRMHTHTHTHTHAGLLLEGWLRTTRFDSTRCWRCLNHFQAAQLKQQNFFHTRFASRLLTSRLCWQNIWQTRRASSCALYSAVHVERAELQQWTWRMQHVWEMGWCDLHARWKVGVWWLCRLLWLVWCH